MKPLLNRHKLLTQGFEYLISGGVYFWVGYSVFALCWTGLGWSLWWAKLAANLVGWTSNFLMQRYWVFNNSNLIHHKTQITNRYIFITMVDFLLDYLIVSGLLSMGITPYAGQFISAGFFTGWNYFWYRFWVFPEKFAGQKTKISVGRVATHRAHGTSAYHLG